MCMAHHAYDKTAWQTWRIKYNKSAFLLFLYKIFSIFEGTNL